jgi:hypothetical protein
MYVYCIYIFTRSHFSLSLLPHTCRIEEKFEDNKGVIRSRKSKDRQYNEQRWKKVTQWSTKHYMENLRLSNTKPTKTKSDLIRCGKVNSSCSTSGTHRITNEFGSFVLMLSVIESIFRYLLYNDFIFNIYSNGLRTSFYNLLVPLYSNTWFISRRPTDECS